jgi:probable addiction module antidote protein
MSKAKPPTKLPPFDAARYLTDDAAIAEYLAAVGETGDPGRLLRALDDVARARGMARDVVAELAGALKGSEIGDSREEYTEYLREKYS